MGKVSQIRVTVGFAGGPLHAMKAQAHELPETLVLIDQRDRRVLVYTRDPDDMIYQYQVDQSVARSENYDHELRNRRIYAITF